MYSYWTLGTHMSSADLPHRYKVLHTCAVPRKARTIWQFRFEIAELRFRLSVKKHIKIVAPIRFRHFPRNAYSVLSAVNRFVLEMRIIYAGYIWDEGFRRLSRRIEGRRA